MANPGHVEIVKQGAEALNAWRRKNPDVRLNLISADLVGAELSGANLNAANLRGADLHEANLHEANLHEAKLDWAHLCGAHLCGANLTGAVLDGANLSHARVSGADLSGAACWYTVFAFVDLSDVKGLDSVEHDGPSSIGIETVYESKGEIPESFLRGAGVPETFITFAKSLVGKPFEFYSCFISYSSKDQDFADRLHADLQARGVRCWFAPEDLKIGDRFRARIDEAIRIHDKLLVVLSENSVRSSWVETEVETAFERENRERRTVLFPIRIDDAVMQTGAAWAANIRRTRHIGDFSRWKSHDSYQEVFERLLRDLKATERSGKES